MRRLTTRDRDDSDINMTPMLDIVFIMLIFFIVTSSFVKETGIDVSRPTAATAVSEERGSILVAVNEGGQVWIDKRQVDIRAVRANIERLRAENPKANVVIQADEGSRHGVVVQVMDSARLAGVAHVSVAAKRIP